MSELPRRGRHYEASPQERYRLHGYSGSQSGPACNTGDGHHTASSFRNSVSCPHCLHLMVTNLKLSLTAQQLGYVNDAKEHA